MEVSHEVSSMVRHWLRRSPATGRTLAPSPGSAVFTPRPERLGLGARPSQDTEKDRAMRKVDRRIHRKVLGKRKWEAEFAPTDPDQLSSHSMSSGEECSRSAIKHRERGGGGGVSSSDGSRRKRKRRKKRKAQEEEEGGGCHGGREGLTGACLLDSAITRPILRGGGGGGGGGEGGGGGGGRGEVGGEGGGGHDRREGGRKRKCKRKSRKVSEMTLSSKDASNLKDATSMEVVLPSPLARGEGGSDKEGAHRDSTPSIVDPPQSDPEQSLSSTVRSRPVSHRLPLHKRCVLRRRVPSSTLPFLRRRVHRLRGF